MEQAAGSSNAPVVCDGLVSRGEAPFLVPSHILEQAERGEVHVFRGQWDEQGVYFYQAYKPEIADWALQHGHFGGSAWKPVRMTWIKPSFAWMLYRAGYGRKVGQERVLRIKLSHATVAEILRNCSLTTHIGGSEERRSGKASTSGKPGAKVCDADTSAAPERSGEEEVQAADIGSPAAAVEPPQDGQGKDRKPGDAGSGRVQWDPERDLLSAETNGREPRKMLRTRAIQIGMRGSVSEFYVENALSIEDVTELAQAVGDAHGLKTQADTQARMVALADRLPKERPYLPQCAPADLARLQMIPPRAQTPPSRAARACERESAV